MGRRKATGILAAAFIWLIIVVALAVAARYFILPYFRRELLDETGSSSRYDHEIRVAADSFSGYSVLRSPATAKDLAGRRIKLTITDDRADYASRMTNLKKRSLDMAVFTIDSFVTAGARMGEFPATIVYVIDETKGADAVIAYKNAVPSIQALDHPEARIVLTPDSPSEFLARTVIAHFNLPNLPEQWIEEADGASDVYQRFKAAKQDAKRAFVLWEPWVSRALEVQGAHVLLDSSKVRGYIVDVLVAERRFLMEHPDRVRAVVEAYARSANTYSLKIDGMRDLVLMDAGQFGGEELNETLAERMAQGIDWKTTIENYAYFGLLPSQEMGQMQHLEDVIGNITDVLVRTGTIAEDPLAGRANTIFHDKILADLKAADFHPAKKLDLIEGIGPGAADLEPPPPEAPLRALSREEWDRLVPVGEMRVRPISFGRGTARINLQSRRDLSALARKLKAMPRYYVLVVGHARAEGDPAANRRLAQERAQAASRRLRDAGIESDRIEVRAAPSSKRGGAAQSVSFLVGLPPG